MQKYLRYSSILILLVFSCKLVAQSLLPELSGKKVQYSASIEMPKAYISGICIILNDSSTYKASIFNEFGISCIECSYIPNKQKVKLHNVADVLDRWYIKHILKKDLFHLFQNLEKGESNYLNKKRNIVYHLSPLNNNMYTEHETIK